jgi:polysaccharide biosynthesis protein PslH
VRLRSLVAGLAASHAISVVAYQSPDAERAGTVEEIRDYCDEVVTVRDDQIGVTGAAQRALQLRSLLSMRSCERIAYARPSFQAALDRLAERRSYDVVHVEEASMMHFRFPSGSPVVLDDLDIAYQIRRRTVGVARSLPRKLYNYLDYLKLKAEEVRSWRRADACALTSPHDEATLRRAAPHTLTAVVPNGADTKFFSPRDRAPERGTMLFFGTIDFYPNTEALLFFLRDVMPLLKRSHPFVRLLVVGPSVPPAIRRWASEDVVITGAVPDIRPYLEAAQVVVVPLRIGGGTRLKILESMAMRKAVVSTSLGAEGLAVTNEREILLGDGADEFAAQVRRVLDDDDLGASLGSAARRLVEAKYDWRASVEQLETLYRSAILAPLAARAGRQAERAAAVVSAK